MKKIIILCGAILMSGCSTLAIINDKDKAERKELYATHKIERREVFDRQKLEIKLLVKTQTLKFVTVGSIKYLELKAELDKIKEALEQMAGIIK